MAERYHYLNVLKTFGMFAILTLHVFATPYIHIGASFMIHSISF